MACFKVQFSHGQQNALQKAYNGAKKIGTQFLDQMDLVSCYQILADNLIVKNRLKQDPLSDNFFIANVPLRLNRQQYDRLMDGNINFMNIEEINDLLRKIIRQSCDEKWLQSTIKYETLDSNSSSLIFSYLESPFLWTLLLVASYVAFQRRFHLPLLTFKLFLLIVFVLSYIVVYQECYYDLKAEEIMMISGNNPCKSYYAENTFKRWIFGSFKQECKEFLKRTQTPFKSICDPLEVFTKMIAKLQITYIGEIFHGVNDTLSDQNVIFRIILYLAIMVFVIVSLMFGIKYTIQYGPGLYFAIQNGNNIQQPELPPQNQNEQIQQNQAHRREIRRLRNWIK